MSKTGWLRGTWLGRYGAAMGLTLIAAALRALLHPIFADQLPYTLFFLSSIIAAYYFGLGPGLVSMIVGIIAAQFLFVSPGTLVFTENAWFGALGFVGACTFVVLMTSRMQQETVRAEQFARLADDERRRLVEENAERLKTEQELRSSEAKFRAVAETAGNAIYIHDGKNLVFVNRAVEEITGYSRDELLVANMWELIHPEDRDRVLENAKRRFSGEGCPQRYEYRIVRKDGSERWLDFSANLIEFEGRQCILATAFDVTDRKNAEETLRKTEKLAATGRLAASIAHEINNPLEAITNLLYLVRSDATNAAKYLELADQELKRVAHLTKQTLGFYRETTHPVPTKVAALLEDVVSIYASRFAHRRIEADIRLDINCKIKGYPGELRQVFSNLIANAADAMNDGGRLQVRLREVTDWKTAQHGIRVTVADNGSGINKEVMRHIFEPFFTTKQEVGTGLGLWVTQGIVDKHRGRLRVRSGTSVQRHGTVFTLFLPLGLASSEADGVAA